MDLEEKSIRLYQSALITITGVGILNHVTIIPPLLDRAGRDSWISVLLTAGIISIWLWMITFISRRSSRRPLFLWIQEKTGSLIAKTFLWLSVIHLFTLGWSALKELTLWTTITYLPDTPQFVIIVVFLSICFFASLSGLRAIVIVNGVLLPIVILFGFFVATANIPNKDHSLLLPVLEHGWNPVVQGVLYSATGLIEILLLLFIQHKIHKPLSYRFLFLLTWILAYLTLGPLIGAITEFGPTESARQRFPAYEEWSLVTLGRFFEHLDFLSIYQWLTGALIRISFLFFMITEIFQFKSKRIRNRVLTALYIALISLALVPLSSDQFQSILTGIILPYSLIYLTFLSLFLFIIALLPTSQKRG